MVDNPESIETVFETDLNTLDIYHTHLQCPRHRQITERGRYGTCKVSKSAETIPVRKGLRVGRGKLCWLKECDTCQELRRFEDIMDQP